MAKTLIRNHTPSACTCHCSKCGVESNAPPGKPHRNCPQAPQIRGEWIKGAAPKIEAEPVQQAA